MDRELNKFDIAIGKYWYWMLIPISIAFTVLSFKSCKKQDIIYDNSGLKAIDSLVIPKLNLMLLSIDSIKQNKLDSIIVIDSTIRINTIYLANEYNNKINAIDSGEYNYNWKLLSENIKTLEVKSKEGYWSIKP